MDFFNKFSMRLVCVFLILVLCNLPLCAEPFGEGVGWYGGFELQTLNNQSIGIGGMYIKGGSFNSINFEMFNHFNLRHKNGDYIYLNKISVARNLFFLQPAISFNNYTDFKGYVFSVAPEIGLGMLGYSFYYSYNFECYRHSLNKTNIHCFTLRFAIPIDELRRRKH